MIKTGEISHTTPPEREPVKRAHDRPAESGREPVDEAEADVLEEHVTKRAAEQVERVITGRGLGSKYH